MRDAVWHREHHETLHMVLKVGLVSVGDLIEALDDLRTRLAEMRRAGCHGVSFAAAVESSGPELILDVVGASEKQVIHE